MTAAAHSAEAVQASWWGGHPERCRVDLHASTTAMPPDIVAQWADLVEPGGFYGGPHWIAGLEAAHGPTAILTVHAAGRLTGALPTWDN